MAEMDSAGAIQRVLFSSACILLRGEIHAPPHEENAALPGLIICHGIPAARTAQEDGGYPALAKRFAGAGFLTLIFNFRGAGESGGNFDILGWMEDLKAAIGYLFASQRVDEVRLSLMGFSGGAAVSICTAASDPRVRAVVACASPSRWDRVGEWASADQYLAHAREVGIIRDSNFPPDLDQWWQGFQRVTPADHVGRIAPRPLLIIHGENDEVVPPRHAHELFSRAGEPRNLRWIPGEGHRLRLSPPAMDAALSWLQKVNGMEASW